MNLAAAFLWLQIVTPSTEAEAAPKYGNAPMWYKLPVELTMSQCDILANQVMHEIYNVDLNNVKYHVAAVCASQKEMDDELAHFKNAEPAVKP